MSVIVKMKSIFAYILSFACATSILCSCTDDDSFSTSTSDVLAFSADTVRLDTVFSTVPTSTRSFWVHNNSGKNIRCTNVRLENGNQSGFRVNVDGAFLSPTDGYQVNDIEIRKGDSARVFVELTSPRSNREQPKLVSDNIVFALESGVLQKVNLNAYSWDAIFLKNKTITNDTVINGERPVVVYGIMTVTENATLKIEPGTTLYFHADAGLDIKGKLMSQGTADRKIILRGDRLDNMFDYLPYDYMSGQWQGILLRETSYGNMVQFTDIHGAFDGIVADSSDVEKVTLEMSNSTIHNCQGAALSSENSKIVIGNCQLTNTLGFCLEVDGGDVSVNNCTLAQFYPFDSNRGSALAFSATNHPLKSFTCQNSLITGYSDNEMFKDNLAEDNKNEFNFNFQNCIIRTPKVETEDSVHFKNVVYEDTKDTTSTGVKHFVKVDSEKQRYDFRLSSKSSAIDKADPTTALPTDHDGMTRDDKPDVGAYEFNKNEKTEEK